MDRRPRRFKTLLSPRLISGSARTGSGGRAGTAGRAPTVVTPHASCFTPHASGLVQGVGDHCADGERRGGRGRGGVAHVQHAGRAVDHEVVDRIKTGLIRLDMGELPREVVEPMSRTLARENEPDAWASHRC